MIVQPNIFDEAFALGKSVFVFGREMTDQSFDSLVAAKNIVKATAKSVAVQKIVDAIKRSEEEKRQLMLKAAGPRQKHWMRMLNDIANERWN